MPDRYGEQAELDTATAELHAVALTVACRYCHSIIGQPCVNRTLDDKPHTRIPHPQRMNDAEEIPF